MSYKNEILTYLKRTYQNELAQMSYKNEILTYLKRTYQNELAQMSYENEILTYLKRTYKTELAQLHRNNVAKADKISDITITATAQSIIPGLLTNVQHGVSVAPINEFGSAGASQVIVVTPTADRSIDIAIPKSDYATHYDIFLSTDTTAPKWVSRITEENRLTGGSVNSVGEFSYGIPEGYDANKVADTICNALKNDSDINTKYDVTVASNIVSLKDKEMRDNDNTLNIAVENGTCEGIVDVTTSDTVTIGHSPTKQVATLTLTGEVTADGTADIAFTSALISTETPAVINVAIGDSVEVIAQNLANELSLLIGEHFTVFSDGANIVAEALVCADDDATMSIAVTSTATGAEASYISTPTQTGYAGAYQEEKIIITGDIITTGILNVTVTMADISETGVKTYELPVWQKAVEGIINVRCVGDGLPTSDKTFTTNNAYLPEVVEAADGSINCAGKNKAYICLDIAMPTKQAAIIKVIPFLKNSTGEYYPDKVYDISVLGDVLKQKFVVDVDFADEMVVLIDDISGTSVDIKVEL